MDQGVAQADEGVSQPSKVSTTRTQDSSLQCQETPGYLSTVYSGRSVCPCLQCEDPSLKGLDPAPLYSPPGQPRGHYGYPDSDRQPGPATRHHGSTPWPWKPVAHHIDHSEPCPFQGERRMNTQPCCISRVRISHGLRSWSQQTADSRQPASQPAPMAGPTTASPNALYQSLTTRAPVSCGVSSHDSTSCQGLVGM